MFHLSVGDHVVALAPVENRAQEIPGLVLDSTSSLGGELVSRVARPTARYVEANVAVAFRLITVHQQLLPVIELRNAGDSQ